jgi:hypothetical protein
VASSLPLSDAVEVLDREWAFGHRNMRKAKSRVVFDILRRPPHRLNQLSNRLCRVMGQSSCEELCCAPRGTRAPSERRRMFQLYSAFANLFLTATPRHLVLLEKVGNELVEVVVRFGVLVVGELVMIFCSRQSCDASSSAIYVVE